MTNPKNKTKRRPYPEKYKKERAILIRKTKPWEHSTGPKTAEGKAKVSQNGLKHGARSKIFTELRAALCAQQRSLKRYRLDL
ncbi:MAG: hypothetical protein CMH26_07305 [Micavibrio sp.]|nr:hypothetical protein [Micavibrio sp.]|tara:strand:+ start:4028 stop:4273 length:246 start_codon:yes stop_codon:yes gene_type:complete